MYVFIFSVKFGKLSGRLLGKNADSAYDMSSSYISKYLNVILFFSSIPRFVECEFLSDCDIF